jgi:hypothetical protein
MVCVTCHVSHRGGWGADYRIDMPADGKGAKGGDVMTKTHAVGSATQYGMRYLLKMIFNVAIGEDDDGNAAAAAAPKREAPAPAPINGRKNSAQAKRDGDHERVMNEVDRLTKEGMADWLANFDAYTSDLPLSWLDPIRDRLHLRRDELFGNSGDAHGQDGTMDAAFAGAVGRAA